MERVNHCQQPLEREEDLRQFGLAPPDDSQPVQVQQAEHNNQPEHDNADQLGGRAQRSKNDSIDEESHGGKRL